MNSGASNFEEYWAIASQLASSPPRTHCALCGKSLQGETFNNRGIAYVRCSTCQHVQSRPFPPNGYPHSAVGNDIFSDLYPELDKTAYISRRDRIYTPKLNWIIESLEQAGIRREKIITFKWTELGCGAGYFLSALTHAGAQKLHGVEADKKLTFQAKRFVPEASITTQNTPLYHVIMQYPSDIYVAWFVLEHIADPNIFFRTLSQLPKGTIFAFSVPMLSLATILDICFDNFRARHLDNIVHTQIYTDKSINYALKTAKMDILSQWIFGQDVEDLVRYVTSCLKNKMSTELFNETMNTLFSIQDEIQAVIDKKSLAEQRHILAIKS